MGYDLLEIPAKRQDWARWLRTFMVGEEKLAELVDRSKIATSISNNFHRNTPYRFRITKVDEQVCKVTRLPDEHFFPYKGYDCRLTLDGLWVVYKGKEYFGSRPSKEDVKQFIRQTLS